VEFDVRGVVNLRGYGSNPEHKDFPSKVEGIAVTNY
jgi:hypothetical protein